MAKKDKNSFFWLSYSDLMTSLFFIILVLFIVTVAKFRSYTTGIEAEKEQLEAILQLGQQFEGLTKSSTLEYRPDSRKFIAKDLLGEEIFEPEKSVIKQEYITKVLQVGKDLDNLLHTLNKNTSYKYLLVIEGNSANSYHNPRDPDYGYTYRLSYDRALALYNYWRQQGINLRQYNTEILICGSGLNGIDRDKVEENNKRFTIQILPKISKPEK